MSMQQKSIIIDILTLSPGAVLSVTDVGDCRGKLMLKANAFWPSFFTRRSWSLRGKQLLTDQSGTTCEYVVCHTK